MGKGFDFHLAFLTAELSKGRGHVSASLHLQTGPGPRPGKCELADRGHLEGQGQAAALCGKGQLASGTSPACL